MRDLDKLLLDAVVRDDVEEAKALLDSGADINLRVRWLDGGSSRVTNASLLCEALIHESVSCTALLLERGIFSNDDLAMECACGSKIADAAIIERLIADGADPHRRYLNGTTYLHFAESADVVEALVKAGVPVDARCARDETALMWAAKEGRLEACSALIGAGADAKALNVEQETALHLCAKQGRFNEVAEHVNSGKISALLIAHGANPEARDHLGQTSLHLAASANNVQCAGVLLDAGASLDLIDKRGYAPEDLAVKDDVKALFLAHRESRKLSDEVGQSPVQARRRL